MISKSILLKKIPMKNQTGFYFYLLAKNIGFVEIKGFSAKRPSKTYSGLDYFRLLEIDFITKKDTYKLDSILKIEKDYAPKFLSKLYAYKAIVYIQQILIKVLMPLFENASQVETEKIFSDLLFLYENMPYADNNRLIKLVYRFLNRVYVDTGFIEDDLQNLSTKDMLNKIRFYHYEFIDDTIKLFDFPKI